MTSKEQAEALCYEIESHSSMVLNMTSDERAELFKAIQEAIPIKELLEVARAAEVLHGEINVHGGHGTPTFGDRAVCYAALNDFEIALTALRAKLPKEMQP